jgi:hypothetical protein
MCHTAEALSIERQRVRRRRGEGLVIGPLKSATPNATYRSRPRLRIVYTLSTPIPTGSGSRGGPHRPHLITAAAARKDVRDPARCGLSISLPSGCSRV